MRYHWLEKQNNDTLLVIALGWGASPEVVGNQRLPEGSDVLCVFDYSTFEIESHTIQQLVAGYEHINLFAWSFGVWASEQVLQGVRLDRAVAVGGSPFPINKDYGIDPRAFQITLNGILNEGVVKFVARMCGSELATYMKNHSTRALDDSRAELSVLFDKGQLPYSPTIKWSRAILCERDMIFPTATAANYWQSSGVETVILPDKPHYPFSDSDFLAKALV